MGHHRHQIEKHAKAEFALTQEGIALKHADKQRRVLAEIARRGNTSGYLPALTTLGEKHIREQILALADAYATAFTFFGLPCDVEAEKSLEVGAKLVAADSIAGILGQLDLIRKRARVRTSGVGHPHREIEQATQSAIKAGKAETPARQIQSFRHLEVYRRRPISAAVQPQGHHTFCSGSTNCPRNIGGSDVPRIDRFARSRS